MKKLYLIPGFLLILTTFVSGQVTDSETALRAANTDSTQGWKKGGNLTLNLSQTSLTNWAAGGENSIGLNGVANWFGNYKNRNSTWDNSFDIGYGFLKQGDAGYRKTDDKVEFMSKYGQKAFNSWYYAAMLNFKTQMDVGYNYPNDSVIISKFLAPAYIMAALGLDYKRSDVFSAFIAPVTSKITIVNDQALADSGAFGVERGNKSRIEFGGYVRLAYKKDLMQNVNFATKIELFSNYLKNPEKIDVNWELLLTLQANEYLSASISTQLIYDYDILIGKDENDDSLITADEQNARVQFKELLAIGITLKF